MEDIEDAIAVVGMGCNFPGGEGLENFWSVLSEGKNCVQDIPAERFDTTFWFDADVSKPGKMVTTKAAPIEGLNEFDHKFFGITEVESDFMDPQQKLLLHCTYRALEDAGISMESISGSRTGVYIGLMNRDYEILRNDNPDTITHYNGTGTAMSITANRISFTFNLTGPSLAIDSACSSSLVALHVACHAIKQGDCEMAVCGGVNCILEPRVFVALSKAKMISPEGTSKPFSIRADGYGRGEGCGVVLLKPFKHAIKDHNKIWGIIGKTAVNQDGRSVSPITKPSMIQQEELLRHIYSQTDIVNVQYIEAHGTGTPVGDPAEAGSISNVIAKARPPGSQPLLIGSLKGNIGHIESAAGVAGVIKVLLMMKHKMIVPSVFYSNSTSSVDVKALSLKIPTKAEKWESNGPLGRLAGVNSFGFGGTNAHVLLREYSHRIDHINIWPRIFLLSAASEKSMILNITDTHQKLCSQSPVDLQAFSYTSACRRSHSKHKYRKGFSASSLSDFKHQLTSALSSNVESVRSNIKVVFVFCGNGVSYRGMCGQLMRDVLIFRKKVKEVEKIFQSHKDINLTRWLTSESSDCDLSQPDVVQPLLLAVQIGISSMLKSWGIKPDAVLGHSFGEIAAAHCSGLLSLEDAVKVCFHRSTLQKHVMGGKMLVISNVEVKMVYEVLSLFSGKISIAAINSPLSCTVSGEADAVDTLHKKLKMLFPSGNLFLHLLDVPAAYHSHLMDPVLGDIKRSIGLLDCNNIECQLFSTVTGGEYSHGDFSSGNYWAENVRKTVLFEQALHAIFNKDQFKNNTLFLEIGPRQALQRYIQESLGQEIPVFSSVLPGKDCDSISLTLAKLFELGINIDWDQVYNGCETLPTALPFYQFDTIKKGLSFEALRKGNRSSTISQHALIVLIRQNGKEFVCNISLETVPYLWEHRNSGIAMVPGAFYVELAYAAILTSLQPKKPTTQVSVSISFESVLTLHSGSQQLTVTVDHSGQQGSFEIRSSATRIASGGYHFTDQRMLEETSIHLETIFQRCNLVMTREEVYSTLSHLGFKYGPIFKQLDDVHLGNEFNEAVTKLQLPSEVLKHLHEYALHPVVLDYFMQMTSVMGMDQVGKQGFPTGIGAVVISGPLQEKMVMYLRATQENQDFLDVCGCFASIEGNVLVELQGVRISFLNYSLNTPQLPFFHNEIYIIAEEKNLQNCQMKAIIFADKLGIVRNLKPYISPESVIVENIERTTADQVKNLVFNSLREKKDVKDVLFIWGVENLSHLSSEKILDRSVTWCETFRWIVMAIKASRRHCTIRAVTYRATEMTVDHVSPGFVLAGMIRACAAEVPDLCFQLIDLASIAREDIQMLAHVVETCQQQEVIISKGQVLTTKIARTFVKDENFCDGDSHSVQLKNYVLQTSDPYRMAQISAIPCDPDGNLLQKKSVKIQLTKVCAHSSDFFPVSASHLNCGKTIYWTRHTSQNHKVLAIDFCGTVTAIGKNVKTIRVGDHVACCYPVTATRTVTIPEAVCYSTTAFPFLKETPCVSFFILAWQILQGLLLDVQNHPGKLAIISTNPAGALARVLALTANRSGWIVSSWPHFPEGLFHFDAFVFLPPFDPLCLKNQLNNGIEKHIVFLCSSDMSPRVLESIFAFQNEHVYVHKLDVAGLLHRATLQAQRKHVASWLLSFGFDASSVPLKGKLHHLEESESYFTITTIQHVALGQEGVFCPVSNITLLPRSRKLFKENCVYIVSGGISGLGLESVKFIAHNGGGFIATLSRSFPTEEKQLEMNLLQKRCNVVITNIQCDVSDSTQVVDAFYEIGRRFPACSVKGVFHSAAVLHDALIDSLDESLFRKVLQPKVSGVLNLHFATLHHKLDFFVCYSSISSFIGNSSQCNYAAANSFLDVFCHFRRNLGLAGQSINWGPLNLGLLLNKKHIQEFLEAKGIMIMDVGEVHQMLKKCLLLNRPQQVICKFNFRNLRTHVLSQNSSLRERLSVLVEAELRKETRNEPKAKVLSSSHVSVRRIVGDILNISWSELDDDSSLHALGIDSMLAMTLQNRIFQEKGVNVPFVVILDPKSTIASLENVVANNKTKT